MEPNQFKYGAKVKLIMRKGDVPKGTIGKVLTVGEWKGVNTTATVEWDIPYSGGSNSYDPNGKFRDIYNLEHESKYFELVEDSESVNS